VDAAEAGKLDFAYFAAPLVATLKRFGVDAQATGRNDITVDGAKFSGNAQYIRDGRVMHHGTILFDSELSVVSGALAPHDDKFLDKAVQSVRSRVTNLKPYLGATTLADLKAAFVEEIGKSDAMTMEKRAFTPADIAAASEISRQRYATWDWNFGKSPDFQQEKRRRIPDVGILDVHLSCQEGRISDSRLSGDYFGDGDCPELRERLTGAPLEEGALRDALNGLDVGRFFHNLSTEDFVRTLCINTEAAG
jgi:lipoate-protein ligase A